MHNIKSIFRREFSSYFATPLALGGQFDVSFYELSSRHNIRVLVVRTLMTYLELDGYLEGGTPFYSSFKFQALTPSR